MAKFTEYNVAPNSARLSPDKEAYSAFEQAGRRVGSLYNEAGSYFKQIGELQDRSIRAQDWPLDFAAFGAGGGGGGSRGVGVRSGGLPRGGGGGGGGSGYRGGRGGGGRSPTLGQASMPMAKAAQLVDGWGNAIGDDPNVTVFRGDKRSGASLPFGGNPAGDIGRETANQQDPQFDILPPNAGRPDDETNAPMGTAGNPASLWNAPNGLGFDRLMNQINPDTAPSGGGGSSWGGYLSDVWNSVSSAASSAATAVGGFAEGVGAAVMGSDTTGAGIE